MTVATPLTGSASEMSAHPVIHQDRIRRRESLSPPRMASSAPVARRTKQFSARKSCSRPPSCVPVGDRDQERPGSREWWRAYVRDTPNPGAYDVKDFLYDLDQRPGTYNFKGTGRLSKLGNFLETGDQGPYLLPGCYDKKDFVQEAAKRQWTYNFKSIDREAGPKIGHGFGDKEISTSPNQYIIADAWGEPVKGSRYAVFKSETKRFPTLAFKPKEGPSPGHYNPNSFYMGRKAPEMTSSFKSVVPRFSTKQSKVPGPGTYSKTFQTPMPKTISQMGRQHGMFFQTLSVYS